MFSFIYFYSIIKKIYFLDQGNIYNKIDMTMKKTYRKAIMNFLLHAVPVIMFEKDIFSLLILLAFLILSYLIDCFNDE